MRCAVSILVSLAASGALALPAPVQPRQHSDDQTHHTAADWNQGATTDFVIHPSCNATEVAQLRKGLHDALTLAEHAKQHILRYGNSSEHYRKYFGVAPSGEAIGYYERVINGDKGDALFRCDNPDGNCNQPEWGGHWRGSNATNETVICPLSYSTRRPLEQLCALGYTVAGMEANTYFGSDLLHRLYHMPAFGENHVEHFAEDYAGALELAKTNATYATHDSDILQYFALDVYAYDIAVPGVGCSGQATEAASSHGSSTSSVSAPPMSSQTATATNAGTAPDAAADAPTECHTHADGTQHCT
ncbi:MAG: hypothetical protein L6R40_005256 [Gallowayella cf. fulva]|nr:MAG: hypothetical protein L6R40_005256 [Xanthomendoza cf. fulva]